MTKLIVLTISFMASILWAQDVQFYHAYFNDQTMRIDYYHVGAATRDLITIDHIYQHGPWAGSRVHLLDHFNNGKYYVEIYDRTSGRLIFSRGFDSFFAEYQGTQAAGNGVQRAYHESILIPYPRKTIRLVLKKRNDRNLMEDLFSTEIDPNDLSIIREPVLHPSAEITEVQRHGDPHGKVDVVILAEGYTLQQKNKYLEDLDRFHNYFFQQEPYRGRKNDFNIYGIFIPSKEPGVDEPRAGIYRNTVFNASFNALGSERYLMTEDNRTMRDIAALVPYDAICLMVNHSRYGGGGIYNQFCTFTSDNQWQKYLFIHELGHSFAGLADEYYTSDVSYDSGEAVNLEPVEPNVTALSDPGKIKWQSLLTPDTQVPTPWRKEQFDQMDYAWQAERRVLNDRIAELKRSNAPRDEIERAEREYALKDKAHAGEVDEFFRQSPFTGIVGAFEGARYKATGMYRPMLDCIMFSKGDKPFCRVCEAATSQVIDHFTE